MKQQTLFQTLGHCFNPTTAYMKTLNIIPRHYVQANPNLPFLYPDPCLEPDPHYVPCPFCNAEGHLFYGADGWTQITKEEYDVLNPDDRYLDECGRCDGNGYYEEY